MVYSPKSHFVIIQYLETLTRLVEAYIYEIELTDPTNEVAEMLTNTLLSQTDLQISDSDFILRAYGESLDLPDSWEGQANARLIIAEGLEPTTMNSAHNPMEVTALCPVESLL